MRESVKHNPAAKTLNKGRPVKRVDVELSIYEWIMELREKDIVVSTRMLMIKALSIDASFHGGPC